MVFWTKIYTSLSLTITGIVIAIYYGEFVIYAKWIYQQIYLNKV